MSNLTNIRLLALDLDGTVLTSDKHLSPRTKKALLLAADSGIEIVLVTGRPLFGLPEELTEIPQIHYAITSNGAVSQDLWSGKKLRTAFLDKEDALQILSLPIQKRLLYNVFIDGYGYCSQEMHQALLKYVSGTPVEEYVLKSRRSTPHIMDFVRGNPSGVENIWIRANTRDERDELHEKIQKQGNFQMVLTADTDVEVGIPTADKGMALTELSEGLGFSKEQILSFGDNYNDLGMFRAAGTSVAMGNAPDSIKQLTSLTTDTNDNDGVAKILEQLL